MAAAEVGHLPERLRTLQRSECLAFLRRSRRGRAAFAADGLLTVVPTRFALGAGWVWFPNTLLARAAGQVVTFQCDGRDAVAGEQWSVCVTGRAERGPTGEVRLAPTLLRGWARPADAEDEPDDGRRDDVTLGQRAVPPPAPRGGAR
jgi:hypothetical protein